MAFSWNVPSAQTVSLVTSSVPDTALAAINTLVTANSTGTAAKWEVKTYVSTGTGQKCVLLGRKSGAAGRLVFFGAHGQTPHANAVQGSATASVLYVGYSATSTANALDGLWTTGAPLSASDYLKAYPIASLSASTNMRCSYAEGEPAFCIIFSDTGGTLAIAGGGEIVVAPNGTSYNSAVFGPGNSGSASAWANVLTNSASLIPPNPDSSYTNTDAGLTVLDGTTPRRAFRAVTMSTGAGGKLRDSSNLIAYFLPMPLLYDTTDVTKINAGKMRQIAFGPRCDRETVHTVSGTSAYGQQATTTGASSPGFWFIDVEV